MASNQGLGYCAYMHVAHSSISQANGSPRTKYLVGAHEIHPAQNHDDFGRRGICALNDNSMHLLRCQTLCKLTICYIQTSICYVRIFAYEILVGYMGVVSKWYQSKYLLLCQLDMDPKQYCSFCNVCQHQVSQIKVTCVMKMWHFAKNDMITSNIHMIKI